MCRHAVHDVGLHRSRRRLGVVTSVNRHLDNPLLEGDGLGDHLGIEDEVVGVPHERDRLEQLPRIRSIPGVQLAEMAVKGCVLDPGQSLVGDESVARHPAPPGGAGLQHPTAQDEVGLLVHDGRHQVGKQDRVVLPVRVKHDDHVGLEPQCLQVADLLISSISHVVRQRDRRNPELPSHLNGPVTAAVVDEQDVVDRLRDGLPRFAHRSGCVVGWHDHKNRAPIDHRNATVLATSSELRNERDIS